MENKPNHLKYSQVEQAREDIARGIENDAYRLYVMGSGPLIEELLSEDVRNSPGYINIVDYVGWPSRDDDAIAPATLYTDNESFLKALLGDEDDERVELNNFAMLISQVPTFEPFQKEGMDGIYARMPALHRLYALMPDLSQSTQRLFVDIQKRQGYDIKGRNAELSLGVNNDLITGLRMMYTVMGRLFTTSDRRLQSKLLFPNNDVSELVDVTDAFVELRT